MAPKKPAGGPHTKVISSHSCQDVKKIPPILGPRRRPEEPRKEYWKSCPETDRKARQGLESKFKTRFRPCKRFGIQNGSEGGEPRKGRWRIAVVKKRGLETPGCPLLYVAAATRRRGLAPTRRCLICKSPFFFFMRSCSHGLLLLPKSSVRHSSSQYPPSPRWVEFPRQPDRNLEPAISSGKR